MLNYSKFLIVTAHPDDEAYGMGGTLHKLLDSEKEVHWINFTLPKPDHYDNEFCQQRKLDYSKVVKYYNFKSSINYDYDDGKLDLVSFQLLCSRMQKNLDIIKPDVILMPSKCDWNFEHSLVYNVVESSTKPIYSKYVKAIYAYEIPSSTDWKFQIDKQFCPTVYVSIHNELERKLKLCNMYSTEHKLFPHSRSDMGVEILAKKRGLEVGQFSVETFMLLRQIL